MSEITSLIDPQLLARLHGLRLRPRRSFEGVVAGQHRSSSRGFSVEFASHREYAAGDDLRYLDWKVLGRTDKYYLKEFEAETNLVCHLLLDVSQSMSYRGPGAVESKFDYARRMAAALAYVVLQQHDSAGLLTFDEEVVAQSAPAASPAHLNELLRTMPAEASDRKTACGHVLGAVADRLQRRGVVVVLSDGFDDVESLLAGIAQLRRRRHDVVFVQILDPAEIDFPFRDPTRFRGLEAWPDLAVSPRAVREAYRREFGAFLQRLEHGCLAHRADYWIVRTDQSPAEVLGRHLDRKMT